MQLAPEHTTTELRPGAWSRIPVSAVAVGRRLRVEPGERIPLDGLVRRGHSPVNQAPVTGESLPVEKGSGDPVFADMGTSLLVIANGLRLLRQRWS